MPIYTELKGFTNVGQNSITELIETNYVMFWNWGLINKGGFFNVRIPSSGQYGGNKEVLRLVNDKNYATGRVWEGYRSNWVWESGLSTATQPVQISGVYVNSVFYPSSTSGTYAHRIDYPKGRVVFNSPIATNSVVKCEYSYRWVSVISSDKIPWFKEVQYQSLRIDSPYFSMTNSGDWFELGSTRLQLPTIIVEVPTGGSSKPYALGGGEYVYRQCIFHVFTEDEPTAMRISDWIQHQQDWSIFTVNLDTIAAQRRFPLDQYGSIASGALTYPQMVEQFMSTKVRALDVDIQRLQIINPSLFYVPVRFTAETILGNI